MTALHQDQCMLWLAGHVISCDQQQLNRGVVSTNIIDSEKFCTEPCTLLSNLPLSITLAVINWMLDLGLLIVKAPAPSGNNLVFRVCVFCES